MANPIHALYPSQEARLAFGRTLTLWLERGGWSHDIPLRWGKAADFPAVADSTFNKLQRGKIEQPYPVTFIQLGLMNARLASGDYGAIEDMALLARISRQKPITHEDGDLWLATDFFAHFIGEEQAPIWARQRPLPTEQQASAASEAVVEQFRAIARRHGLSLLLAWQSLASQVAAHRPRPLNGDELEVLRSVLSGWHVWTPGQLQDLIDVEGVMRAELALSSWARSLEQGQGKAPSQEPAEPPDLAKAKDLPKAKGPGRSANTAKAAPKDHGKPPVAALTKPRTKTATGASLQESSRPKEQGTGQGEAPLPTPASALPPLSAPVRTQIS
jgi:hypothetical protein